MGPVYFLFTMDLKVAGHPRRLGEESPYFSKGAIKYQVKDGRLIGLDRFLQGGSDVLHPFDTNPPSPKGAADGCKIKRHGKVHVLVLMRPIGLPKDCFLIEVHVDLEDPV